MYDMLILHKFYQDEGGQDLVKVKQRTLNTKAGRCRNSLLSATIIGHDMVVPFPDIPLDIARLLFETAAWEHPPTAYSLALVSKVVRRW